MRLVAFAVCASLLATWSCSGASSGETESATRPATADAGWTSSPPERNGDAGLDGSSGDGPDGSLADAASGADAATNVTTLRIRYRGRPGVLSLRGAGGPLSWTESTALTEVEPGLFEWSAPDLVGELEWKPMLGDAWSLGPNYRVIAGSTLEITPRFFETRGTVERKWPTFTSALLPSTRGIWVSLPPTYVENAAARLDVLYMHDGQNLFSSASAFGGHEWQVDETLDQGAADGSIREEIVIGIENGGPDRIDELTPSVDPGRQRGGDAEQYLAMIETEIMPLVNGALRTHTGPEHTALVGSSLGGLNSVWAGVHHADAFGRIGAMSPSTWWDGGMILGAVDAMSPVRPSRIYVDSGNAGDGADDFENTATLVSHLRSQGYVDGASLEYVLQPGALHNEIYWAERLPHALSFLLGPR